MTCVHLNDRVCSLGLYGGRPSPGVCQQCPSYDGPPRGVGDVVETVARKTGIKGAVKRIVGECVGCEERRQWLNRTFPRPDAQ